MRSNFIISVIATGMLFIATGVFANPIGLDQSVKSTQPISMEPAQGLLGNGFSALQAHRDNVSKEGFVASGPGADSAAASGLVRPNGQWQDGLSAVSAAAPQRQAPRGSVDTQQAMVPQGGVNSQGFSAIKATSGLRSESAQPSEMTRARAGSAPDVLVSPPAN